MPPIVVVVGSLHYDILLEAPHLPARGETVTGQSWRPKFGGKGGNQALAARAAGAEVRFVGCTGRDVFGRALRARLAAAGIDADRIAESELATGISVAICEPTGDYGAAIVSGANLSLDPDGLAEPALWRGAQALVLQNEIPETANRAAATAARRAGLTVILNAAPMRHMAPDLLASVDMLIVNAVEAAALSGQPVGDLDTALAAARALTRQVPTAIVTAGGAGVAWAGRFGTGSRPAERVPVVSTHGAGDCFTGTLAATHAAGAALAQAIAQASRAAARHVAAPVDYSSPGTP